MNASVGGAAQAPGWHAGEHLLALYASGELDDVRAASLEAHVVACAACRSGLSAAVPADLLDGVWSDVVDQLDRPKQPLVARALHALGVPEHTATLIAATPSLRWSWLVAVTAAVAFGALAGQQDAIGAFAFLLIAPMVPVVGVAGAFSPRSDPAYEVAATAPISNVRLVMVRSVAVLITAIVVAGLSGLALPGLEWTAAAWILPSLALASTTLVLSTVTSPERAAVTTAGAWATLAIVVAIATDDRLAAFRLPGQIASIIVTAAAAMWLARTHHRFDTWRTT